MQDWDIVGQTANGALSTLEILEDLKGFIKKRNGVTWHMKTGEQERTRFLYADIDGLRVYLRHGSDGKVRVTITRQDLLP